MPSIDERISKDLEKLEQLKRQANSQIAKQKRRQAAIAKNRERIIGRMVMEHFPEVLRFQPHRSDDENRIEFAPLSHILSALAADTEYLAILEAKAIAQFSQDTE